MTGPCDAGHYCIEGAKVSDPTDNITGAICPKGRYCPTGTYDPQECPKGTYSNSTGNKNVSDCQACLPGHYCDAKGLQAPAGECDPGFFCPGGQSSQRPPSHVCTPGHYCPAGSVEQRPCVSGEYQDEYQQWQCKECPAGFYCDATLLNVSYCVHGVQLPQPCIAGHYCLSGTKYARQHPCRSGTSKYYL